MVAWNYTSATGAVIPSDVRGVAAFIDPGTGTETITAVGGLTNRDLGDPHNSNYSYIQQLDSSRNLTWRHTATFQAGVTRPNALNSVTPHRAGHPYPPAGYP